MTPYYADAFVTLYHGDCREVLPAMADDSFGLVLTDPPYGVNKAAWDDVLPLWWLDDAARVAPVIGVMPGTRHLLSLPLTIGSSHYRWTLAAHITNGMTRSAVGFQNWFPCVVYAREGVRIYRDAQDSKSFAVRGTRPDHPSPKPISAMRWLLSVLDGAPVLDPFAGSGTTLLAAREHGRRAVGIECEERYCELIATRLAQDVLDFGAAS